MKYMSAILVLALLATAGLITGCGGGDEHGVSVGDTVSVYYTGTFSDGTVFDSNVDGEPLEFVMGSGAVVPGFEKAVSKMKVGEKKTVTIPPEEAYGKYNEDLVVVISKDQIPEGTQIQMGQKLPLRSNKGDTMTATVVEITDDYVKLDGNDSMAGKKLTFEIELISVRAGE